jgi:membrane-associated phospholipid phosphatase
MIKRIFSRLSLADRLTLGYLLWVVALVITCQARVADWAWIVALHALLAVAIIALAQGRSRHRWIEAVAAWYPLFLFGIFFEEIGRIVHAIHPGWFDELLIAADYYLFGVHPTVWIERYASYWLTEYMQLAYTSYLVLAVGFGAWLWRRGRREEFATLVVASCVNYYLNYMIFVLFPIESPYHTLQHLQQVELAGGPVTALIEWIERYGRVHGGAFPSAHVSGSIVVLWCAWRSAPRFGALLTPLVLSICVATIYGRYHYAVDVVAGALLGTFATWIAARLRQREAAAALRG